MCGSTLTQHLPLYLWVNRMRWAIDVPAPPALKPPRCQNELALTLSRGSTTKAVAVLKRCG